MKNQADKILLAVFLLSLCAYAVMVWVYITYSFTGFEPSRFEIWFIRRFLFWMAAGFHAVPAFCLQLLLCRRKRRWAAAFPLLAFTGAAAWSAYEYSLSTGHDGLGWIILLILSIAPAVGCALAWVAYICWKQRRKGDIHVT